MSSELVLVSGASGAFPLSSWSFALLGLQRRGSWLVFVCVPVEESY